MCLAYDVTLQSLLAVGECVLGGPCTRAHVTLPIIKTNRNVNIPLKSSLFEYTQAAA
jgi:hypothetical protein